MDVVEKIRTIIEPSVDAMGYELVLIKLADGSRRKTLTLMAERKDGGAMGIEDCTQVSRMAGALLEVDDPISGSYDLEVCSPGIDRPLTKPNDFEKYTGYEAKIETLLPIDGRKRFRGVLKGLQGESVEMVLPEGTYNIPLGNVRTAKLVMTDALMGEHLKKHKKKA